MLAECHLAYPLVPWVVLLVALRTLLIHHIVSLLVLYHFPVLVLVQNVRVYSGLHVGMQAGVEVPRTASDAQLEVLQRTMLLLALHCTPYVVGPPGTVVEVQVRIMVGVHTISLQTLPAIAGGAQ